MIPRSKLPQIICMLRNVSKRRGSLSSPCVSCRISNQGTSPLYPVNFCKTRYVSNSCVDLPWLQNARDIVKDDPFHHKLVGMILLRRVVKNASKQEFNLNEFISGAKLAIKALAHSIQSQDKDDIMIRMLGSELQIRFRQAFDEMKKKKQRIILDVESLKDFKISGVRAIFGGAEPGDEYFINCLGQRITTSKRDMFEVEKRADLAGYSALFDFGRKLGISAAEKEIRFQIDVKFSTSERFYIEEKKESGWHLISGGVDILSVAHLFRFESILEDSNTTFDDYPLSWKIVDIDFEEVVSLNEDG